jgi:hypothetical protein
MDHCPTCGHQRNPHGFVVLDVNPGPDPAKVGREALEALRSRAAEDE